MVKDLNIPVDLEVKVKDITDMLVEFGTKVLDDLYNEKFLRLTEAVANCENLALNRGKTGTWAAGIAHSIFFINDTLSKKGIHMDELADFFSVSESTIGTKSREIRKALNIQKDNSEWKISEEDTKEVKNDDSKEILVVDKFNKALEDENIENGAKEIEACLNMLKESLGSEYFKDNNGNIGVSAEGDFFLSVQATLSAYVFALGDFRRSFELEKELLEFNEADTKNVRHSLIFRALLVKEYDYVKELFEKFKEDDSVFFKYARVLYSLALGDRQGARKWLKKATKHNFKVIECLYGGEQACEGEILYYEKGSIEEATLCMEFSLPLWNDKKVANWIVTAIKKIK
ncbi:DUF6398 domain-containing protein [uncultured Clostridium sp.]|uniref:DUF6398 domain-containing protein n=1 Tax=uncultured Clostridium sp. TaxID=59620 RepID=UPI0026154396|nr:DUF6398 domain-containing protein [uncultured Clostridium sp.]